MPLPLRAMFRNAGQPRRDVLSSAWSRCLRMGPQGHLGRRKLSRAVSRTSHCVPVVFEERREHLAYLGHLHLLLPRANALLQPPEFLLGPHVLGDAGGLVFRQLAAQTLVESLLPATLLRKHRRRRGAECREGERTSWEGVFSRRPVTNLLGSLQLLFQPLQLPPAVLDVAAQLFGL